MRRARLEELLLSFEKVLDSQWMPYLFWTLGTLRHNCQ